MTNSRLTPGESFLDRTRCQRPEGKPAELLTLIAIVIILMSILCYVVHHMLVSKTSVAHAAEQMTFKDVTSKEAACDYAQLYPEKITNKEAYATNCITSVGIKP